MAMRSNTNLDPDLMELLAAAANVDRFRIGIDTIIHHLQTTLNQSYNRIRKLETSLIQSYYRIGKLHEVKNDRVVFDQSSEAIQREIKFSIEVAENIKTIFGSILPRHTVDYHSRKVKFFLENFSKSENLRVSKFKKKTDFVRNKIVDLTAKLYIIRIRINYAIVESIRYENLRRNGSQANSVVFINTFLSEMGDHEEEEELEEMSMMMKIEMAMKDLEGILILNYEMVQTQIAISAYAISEKWSGICCYGDIRSLPRKSTLSKIFSFTDDIYYYCCLRPCPCPCLRLH